VAQTGSYHQFKCPSKPGRVAIAGKPSDELAKGTQMSMLKARRAQRSRTTMKYAVVIERVGDNLSTYVPALPGCITTGNPVSEAEQLIREVIAFHLEVLSCCETGRWGKCVFADRFFSDLGMLPINAFQ
jgi:predicted RNase H-like HicB family nuclease